MNEEKYESAKKRVREIKDFYTNLLTYVAVNVFLAILNFITSPDHLWFYWVSIFWGLGVVLHGITIFLFKGKILGKDWEEKKIKEFMED